MKKQTLLVLLIVFVLLLGIVLVSPWESALAPENELSSSWEREFSQLTIENVTSIRIEQAGEEKIIAEQDGQWKINGFAADLSEIEAFFTAIQDITVQELVSQNPSGHARFQATQEAGITLTVNDQESFIIGKTGPQYSSFYAKKSDSDTVYLVSGTLRNKLVQSIDVWRDKQVVSIEPEQVEKIEITKPEQTQVFAKGEDGLWKQNDQEITAQQIDQFFTALSPLTASGFLNETEVQEFMATQEVVQMKLYGQNDEVIRELNLLEQENEWWGQVSGEEVYYKIPSYRAPGIIGEME